MEERTCPRCTLALVARTVACPEGPVTVDLCLLGCGGLWLDADDMRHGGDLMEALETGPSAAPQSGPSIVIDRRPRIGCPVCGERMTRYRWNYNSPVLLDQCPRGHGSWLDAGEVRQMQEEQDAEVLDPEKQARLKARMAQARLEVQGRLRAAGPEARAPRIAITLMNLFWDRYL